MRRTIAEGDTFCLFGVGYPKSHDIPITFDGIAKSEEIE